MIRFLTLIVILGLLGFYVGWPAWSGYQIKSALDSSDTAGLARKIDFEAVRQSLRPAVTAEVDKKLSAALSVGGQSPEAAAKAKAEAMPKLVDAALNSVVTPEGVVRIYRERGNATTAVAKIVAEKMASPEGIAVLGSLAGAMAGSVAPGGKLDVGAITGQLGKLAEQAGVDPGKMLGGLLGKKAEAPAKDAAPAAGGKPAPETGSVGGGVGIDNVKSFAMNGLTGYRIGIAKDKTAIAPDIVADIAFTGGDWKLVGLTPRS